MLARELAPPRPPSNPMARRRAKQPNSAVLHVRTTEAEAAEWRAKAEAAGVSASALLRHAMRRTRVWTAEAAGVRRELALQIARIGSNVNQIARKVNTREVTPESVLVLAEMAAWRAELAALREAVLGGGRDAD